MVTYWRSFASLWRQEPWPSRLVIAAVGVAGTLSTANLVLYSILGVLGDWRPDVIEDAASNLAFAGVAYAWIYWRRRAQNAEKPLPPTMVVTEYPTEGAAAVGRWVEQQKRLSPNAQAFMRGL